MKFIAADGRKFTRMGNRGNREKNAIKCKEVKSAKRKNPHFKILSHLQENKIMRKIELRNITHRKLHHNTTADPILKTILDDVSFSVETGEIFAIMGPSGSGKSTLLRLINRLEDPVSGEILVDGKNVREYPVRDLRRKVGLILQLPFMFEGSVEDNLLYGPRIAGINKEEKNKEIESLIPWFGFGKDILDRDPQKLSVGEKQRVSIMRTLLNDPDVIMLDEPTSSLDPYSSKMVLDLIKDINEKKKTTIIVVTHIPEHARRIAHKALIVIKGKVIETGDIGTIFKNAVNEATSKFLSGEGN